LNNLRELAKLEAKLAAEQQALQYVSQVSLELTAAIDRGSRHLRPIQAILKKIEALESGVVSSTNSRSLIFVFF